MARLTNQQQPPPPTKRERERKTALLVLKQQTSIRKSQVSQVSGTSDTRAEPVFVVQEKECCRRCLL